MNGSDVLHLAIEGVRGEYFTIHGPGAEEGGAVLDEDPDLIWETPTSTNWRQGAYQEGGEYQGKKTGMYDIVLPVHISTSSENWLPLWSQFRRAFDFERKAYLVATSDSGVRRLGVQLLETPPFRPKVDPGKNGYALVPMRLRAGWPFWVEQDTVDLFQAKSTSPVTVWDGVPYYSGTVVVSNPTNQPAYLKWIVEAPTGGKVALPDFSWEPDQEHEDYEHRDRMVYFPTLANGEKVVVDSYPDNDTYTSNLNPLFVGRMGGIEFEFPVPPHTPPTEIPIGATKPGTTVMVRQPRNWRTIAGGE
ncbi:hypothetical protein GS885_25770 [Rhodococcus hoagii]|nr:hypothetical protein [Prescottella equi]NKR90323.1 hypothetical protein [Prescottella equi]NKR90367.1 hypothetical protein [Prescottella equi]NKR90407.1 hypothetical protein [Prescottella equi]NKT40041.1 hypothetical protein [Prescottella equi]